MSHHQLRSDRKCQNCGQEVPERYCSHCGQENIETRQSFIHLLVEFAEDLTHYEGSFWKSIRHLLFSPGRLTREYLSGKRKTYLPPVRLYIFTSFVVFLLPHLLPDARQEEHESKATAADTSMKSGYYYSSEHGLVLRVPYKTVAEFDSVENALPEKDRESFYGHWLTVRAIKLQKYDSHELLDKFTDIVARTFPKALFLYMPLFAFIIWLFHGRRRWLYFDHGIFTLHYFSLMLLIYGIMEILQFPVNLFLPEDAQTIYILGLPFIVLSYIAYFFVAHKRVYEEDWGVSIAKTVGILLCNSLLFILLFAGLVIYAISVLH